jgi:hypothetical protein
MTPVSGIGRNEPCSCGSGKKFKHCCLRAHDQEDSIRVRLRSAEGVLVPALFAYALEEFGNEFFDEAWEEFFLWTNVPEDVSESKEVSTTFDPFFAFTFVPDAAEIEIPEGWPTEALAQHFLRHEVESAPDFHREFVEQACQSPASFFVVESVAPGRSLDIKDILTGRRFHVLEQTASRTLHSGDLTYTRVVTAGGGSIMIGACPWVIPAAWHLPIIEMRRRLRPKRLLTREELLDYDMEIRQVYHGIVDALLHPAPPILQNTDGDPLELTALTYELGVTAAEAVERLKPLATLRDEVHIADEQHDATGTLIAATLTWLKAGNRKHKGWDNTTLGTLRIDRTRLVVEVNSARRRQRIEKSIAKYLGPKATLVDTTVTDIAEAIANKRAGGAGAMADSIESTAAPRTPEIEALEAELAQQHWDAWIDMKIPALGNKTPRMAAKTALGRERLDALLAGFAQMSTGRHGFEPDIAALRQKLGLEPRDEGGAGGRRNTKGRPV